MCITGEQKKLILEAYRSFLQLCGCSNRDIEHIITNLNVGQVLASWNYLMNFTTKEKDEMGALLSELKKIDEATLFRKIPTIRYESEVRELVNFINNLINKYPYLFFLLTLKYDLKCQEQEINETIRYWLSFIDNLCDFTAQANELSDRLASFLKEVENG